MHKITTLTNHKTLNTIKATVFISAICLIPELSYAADKADAFAGILEKANSWVGGSAGKLITFSSFVIAGVMGVAGFPVKHVTGAIGVGLLLSSANSIVNMIF